MSDGEQVNESASFRGETSWIATNIAFADTNFCTCIAPMEHLTSTFQPDTLQEIFKFVWAQTAKKRSKEDSEEAEAEGGAGPSKKSRGTNINADALKLSCEYLRLFITGKLDSNKRENARKDLGHMRPWKELHWLRKLKDAQRLKALT